MRRTAKIFGGILALAAIVATSAILFYSQQETARRLNSLESQIAQEVAIRKALARQKSADTAVSNASAPVASTSAPMSASAPVAQQIHPAATPPSQSKEETWRQEMDKKDKQIAYLRSIVERMALEAPPAASTISVASRPGSAQMAVESTPPPATFAIPAGSPSNRNITHLNNPSSNPMIPMNQVVGEVTQVNLQDGFMFINRGSRHGVQEGMVFEVFRKGRPMGRVQAAMIYDSVSSVVSSSSTGSFQSGDMVRSVAR